MILQAQWNSIGTERLCEKQRNRDRWRLSDGFKNGFSIHDMMSLFVFLG